MVLEDFFTSHKSVLVQTTVHFSVELYLGSCVLQPEDAFILNHDPSQTFTNAGSEAVSYEFTRKVVLTDVVFTSGTPQITVYAEVNP